MFTHEFRVKSGAPLKGAEQKKLKATICKYFNLSSESLDDFLTHKQLSQLKLITYAKDIVKINCVQDTALTFECKNKFYPSLYLAWNFPYIIPKLMLDHEDSYQIGYSPELPIYYLRSPHNNHILSSLPADQCVSICTDSNDKIIAIGCLIIPGNIIVEAEDTGYNCLKILHYYGDELFRCYIESVVPDLMFAVEYECSSTSEHNDTQFRTEDTKTINKKMDELLMTCSLKALKYSIKKEMLPILASTFYKKYVMSFCSVGNELDLKKTSYKKLSTFLKLLEKEQIIKFNVGSNGIVEITKVFENNSKFQDINNDGNPGLKEKPDKFSPPVKEVYVVTPGLYPLFSEFLCRKGDELTVQAIRKYITEYIKKHQLQDHTNLSLVNTNDVLKKILSQRKNKDSISIKELIEEITKLMYRTEIAVVNTETAETKTSLKKKINQIEITVSNRSGNKKVTLINNLELYGVDVIRFSKECQHGVAASTKINDVPNAQNRQVQIQGSQVPFVYKLLVDQYKIPVTFLKGHENYIKKK